MHKAHEEFLKIFFMKRAKRTIIEIIGNKILQQFTQMTFCRKDSFYTHDILQNELFIFVTFNLKRYSDLLI
jgi:hypothetical protein